MSKKWSLSDSGLQVYEGRKHIATVHYAGNPPVDVNEAIENATLIRQAPAMEAELADLRADLEKTRRLYADAEKYKNQYAAHIVNMEAETKTLRAQNAELLELVKLAQFALSPPAIRDIRKLQLEIGNSAIADFEERTRAAIQKAEEQ